MAILAIFAAAVVVGILFYRKKRGRR